MCELTLRDAQAAVQLRQQLLHRNNAVNRHLEGTSDRPRKKKRNPEGLRGSSTKGGGFGGVCPTLALSTIELCPSRVTYSRNFVAMRDTFYQSSIKFF
jgi:hypothetical protein